MKRISVFTGTEVAFCSPTHPYVVAVQVKKIIDKIIESSDCDLQFNCNISEGIEMFEQYGHKVKGLRVLYFINNKPATYSEVIEDMCRGRKFLSECCTP